MKSQITLRKQWLPFTQVPNDLICNSEISGLAKSLWCILYSKPDNWVFYWNEILIHFKEGRDAVKKSFKDLEKFGYLKKEQKKIHTGRGKESIFGGMDIILFYEPQLLSGHQNQASSPITENQLTGNQLTGNQVTGNQSTYKYLSKKDLKKKDLTNKSSNNSNSSFSFLPSKKKFLNLEEAKIYKKEKNYLSDVGDFIDYYQSKGWKGITDAYAALDAWERRFLKLTPPQPQKNPQNQIPSSKEKNLQLKLIITIHYGSNRLYF